MSSWRNASLAVTAAALLALTTACGPERGTKTPNGQNVGNADPAGRDTGSGYGSDGYGSGSGYGSDGAEQGRTGKQAGRLGVWNSKKLGKVLTDSEGFTLYRFDKDTASPPESNCEGECAKIWPVVLAGNVTRAAGTDPALIGKVTRSDGTQQLTIAGRPMCLYAKDTAPGDANGQGVGGTWFASAPDGKKAAVNADSPAGAEPAELAGLSVRKDPKLGDFVVDKRGMTVYRFKKDVAWPMPASRSGRSLPIDKERRQRRHDQGFCHLQSARRNQATSHRLLAGPYLLRRCEARRRQRPGRRERMVRGVPRRRTGGRPQVTRQRPSGAGPPPNVTRSDGPVAHATGV